VKGVAIIDFEASCLPEDNFSYPIEVALAKVGGPTHSWLIRPTAEWEFWDWCDEAEALHCISRDMLQREGLPVRRVLAELKEAAAGWDVYADCDLDAYWLETLAAACKEPLPFPVRHVGELMSQRGFERREVLAALDRAREERPTEHVARDDARRLAMTLRLLSASHAGKGPGPSVTA
jgi:hypothetical protein